MNKYTLNECISLHGFYHIPNFENYVINRDGKVFNLKTKNFIKIDTKNNKYNKVEFCLNGKVFNKSLHRILAITFIPRPDHLKYIPFDKLQVNHIDLNKRNNVIDNLEWTTPKENTKHSIDNGKSKSVAVLARDVHFNNVVKFDIAEDCLKQFDISKVKFWKHIKSRFAGTLTKDFYVFKLDDGTPWPKLQKHQIVRNSLLYERRGHWLALNINKTFVLANTLKDLCDLIGLNLYTTSNILSSQGRSSVEGNKIKDWLIQYKQTSTEKDLALLPPKIIKNNKPKPLKLINTLNNEESIFNSYAELSKHLNVAKDKLARALFLNKGKYKDYLIERI